MQTTDNSDEQNTGFAKPSKPITALVAGVRALINLEETQHFFALTDAVDGTQNERNYQRFLKTPTGARMKEEGVNFANIFSQRRYLSSFPEGSLADRYLKFLEAENLDLELLMAAENAADATTIYMDEARRNFAASAIAIHDLLHVVTGYGRDPIGEACLLAYTGEHLNFRGVGLFAHALALREQATHPNMPVLRAMSEARQRARLSTWLPEIDWRTYLGRELDDVRGALGLRSARVYNKIMLTTGSGPAERSSDDKVADRAA